MIEMLRKEKPRTWVALAVGCALWVGVYFIHAERAHHPAPQQAPYISTAYQITAPGGSA